MSAVRDAPEVAVKNLVRDNWDTYIAVLPAAEQFTPEIHHGWVSDSGHYEITASDPDEDAINGGATGYSGIDPSGAGPTQTFAGTVNLNCWADRDRTGINGVSVNPRKAAYVMKDRVMAILRDHPEGAGTDFQRFAPMGAIRLVESDEEPTVWRWQVAAGYGYYTRP